MSLKKFNIYPPVILAPLAGISDAPFRSICRELGAGLAVSEMISSFGLHYNNKKTVNYLFHYEDEKPTCFQIFGNDPDIMAESAVKLAEKNIDIIDINMGCSVPKVKNSGSGASLLDKPKLVDNIISKMVKAVSLPISSKIRIPSEKPDSDQIENLLYISRVIQNAGASFITLHPRTPASGFRGRSDWRFIKILKENLDIPVIGSGDILNHKDALEMFRTTGCDGIMIGRASLGNPWIFLRIKNAIEGKDPDFKISKEEKLNVILKHCKLIINNETSHYATIKLKKHLSWYSKGEKNSAEFRNDIFSLDNPENILKSIEKLFK